MKKLTAEKCREQIHSLKVCKAHFGIDESTDYQLQALEVALPILEQQERGEQHGSDFIKCPFPCGWKELLRVAMNDGAFLSQKLIEGEEVRDLHRHAALSNTDRLVRVITAILDAPEAVEQQERGEGEWIEWRGGASGSCPVAYATLVEVKSRNGHVAEDCAEAFEWCHEADDDDIIAYRIIPEQPTNQNGER